MSPHRGQGAIGTSPFTALPEIQQFPEPNPEVSSFYKTRWSVSMYADCGKGAGCLQIEHCDHGDERTRKHNQKLQICHDPGAIAGRTLGRGASGEALEMPTQLDRGPKSPQWVSPNPTKCLLSLRVELSQPSTQAPSCPCLCLPASPRAQARHACTQAA